ncbi:MAG: arabinogalactan endo-1,4-beta-galactosidase [Flavisolibacter sp.]
MNIACKKGYTFQSKPPNPPIINTFFAKGADVGWVTQMESSGLKFYNSAGKEQDALVILKNLGMNAIRLRVWVNPDSGWCNTADVLAKALRAKHLGMELMIDFHYSDYWADPGKQNKPGAWVSENIKELQTSVYNHTKAVLDTLKVKGIIPKWVQVGNETNNGMLWPEGKASTSMSNFAMLINAGYSAVKSVDSTIKVVVHISNGFDNILFRWIFDGLQNRGAHWDIIGMSLYPSAADWKSLNDKCFFNMNDMVSRYNKDVMICEVGMPWTDAVACNSFLTDLIAKTKSVFANRGMGVFYWEPEAYNNWQGYTLGAFDNTGKPTIALNAFK